MTESCRRAGRRFGAKDSESRDLLERLLVSALLAGPCPASAEPRAGRAGSARGCAARSDFLAASPVICDCHGKCSLFLPRSPSLFPNSSPRLPSASRSHTHTHARTLLPKTVLRPPPQLTSFQHFCELDNPRICKTGEKRERLSGS